MDCLVTTLESQVHYWLNCELTEEDTENLEYWTKMTEVYNTIVTLDPARRSLYLKKNLRLGMNTIMAARNLFETAQPGEM